MASGSEWHDAPRVHLAPSPRDETPRAGASIVVLRSGFTAGQDALKRWLEELRV